MNVGSQMLTNRQKVRFIDRLNELEPENVYAWFIDYVSQFTNNPDLLAAYFEAFQDWRFNRHV